MKRTILVCFAAVCLFTGCSRQGTDATTAPALDKPKPASGSSGSDPRVKKIQDRIAQLSPDCKDAIDRVKTTKLTTNGVKSAVPPGEIADRFAKQPPNIGIGWDAYKNAEGNYDVWYHFRNSKGDITFAKWSYNPKTRDIKYVDAMGAQFSYASK
jgi:hypothetical protein